MTQTTTPSQMITEARTLLATSRNQMTSGDINLLNVTLDLLTSGNKTEDEAMAVLAEIKGRAAKKL